jgi:adenylate cyclase
MTTTATTGCIVCHSSASSFLRNLQKLEELYLSGNQLTSIPTEDLVKMTRLSILSLNGNQFQTLPAELGKSLV